MLRVIVIMKYIESRTFEHDFVEPQFIITVPVIAFVGTHLAAGIDDIAKVVQVAFFTLHFSIVL